MISGQNSSRNRPNKAIERMKAWPNLSARAAKGIARSDGIMIENRSSPIKRTSSCCTGDILQLW